MDTLEPKPSNSPQTETKVGARVYVAIAIIAIIAVAAGIIAAFVSTKAIR